MVAFAHAALNDWVRTSISPVVMVLGANIVPCLFIIAGYLMYGSLKNKSHPVAYLTSYVAKYLGISYAVSASVNVYLCAKTGITTGEFPLPEYAMNILRSPIWGFLTFGQLWFILPLVLAVSVCGLCYMGKRLKLVYRVCIISLPLMLLLSSWRKLIPELMYFCQENRILMGNIIRIYEGLLYTACGMWIAENEESFRQWKWWRTLLVAELPIAIDVFIIGHMQPIDVESCNINLTSILLSLLTFRLILAVKNDVIKPYHRLITLYSGLTYFLHTGEFLIFRKLGIANGIANCICTLVLNAIMAIVINWWIERKRRDENQIEAK